MQLEAGGTRRVIAFPRASAGPRRPRGQKRSSRLGHAGDRNARKGITLRRTAALSHSLRTPRPGRYWVATQAIARSATRRRLSWRYRSWPLEACCHGAPPGTGASELSEASRSLATSPRRLVLVRNGTRASGTRFAKEKQNPCADAAYYWIVRQTRRRPVSRRGVSSRSNSRCSSREPSNTSSETASYACGA